MPRKRQKRNYTQIEVRSCPECQGLFLWHTHYGGRKTYCKKSCTKAAQLKAKIKERAELKEQAVTYTERVCIQCQEPFQSWGPQNRRCERCREGDGDRFRTYSELALLGGRGSV